MLSSRDEIVLPLESAPERVPLATHVRGSVLVSSQRSLRERGLDQKYLSAIAPSFRETLQLVIASTWVPMDAALAHYDACEQLGLDIRTIEEIAGESGRFIYSSVIAIVMRLSSEVGTTPWAIFANLGRFRDRTWHGSAFEVVRLGPKEARIVWYGQPCAAVPYFRHAFGAFLAAAVAPLCTKAYARLLPQPRSRTLLAYRLSWA